MPCCWTTTCREWTGSSCWARSGAAARRPRPGCAPPAPPPAMSALKQTLRQLVEAEQNIVEGTGPAVLVTGETGTGKELVARAIHFDGARRARPFIEGNGA